MVRHNYAQCPNVDALQHIPTTRTVWARSTGKRRPRKIACIRWQLPNTYLVGARLNSITKDKPKVRRRVNETK